MPGSRCGGLTGRHGRWVAVLTLSTVLLLSPAALGEEVRPVDGFLHADTPIALDGGVSHQGAGETLWLTSDEPADQHALTLRADELHVTRVTFEVESARSPAGLNVSYTPPSDGVERETSSFENATVTLEGVGPRSDVVLYPSVSDPLQATIDVEEATGELVAEDDGLIVRDGYRDRNNISQSRQHTFDWAHELPGPQLRLEGFSPIQLDGALRGYAWEVNATVANQTTEQRYDTGYEVRESSQGTVRSEEYTYLLVQATGVQASLDVEPVDAQLYGSAMGLEVDGAASLPAARGTLTTQDGAYHAGQPQDTIVRGNLSMEVTPKPTTTQERVTASLEGDVRDTTLSLQSDQQLASTETVAAAAGGATAFGLAAWYLTSAKGLSLAAVPFLGARRSRQTPQSATPDTSVDEPGDLLFDPDRFALYHLIRERPGLTATECAETAGVPDAGEQLELMVEYDLLETIADDPRRYTLPSAFDPEEADKVALLREPGARRVAEILAVHGLAPETHLLDRIEAADTPLSREGAADLIDRFVEEELAYREQGPEGRVADSTDALHDLLETMGETSLPRIS